MQFRLRYDTHDLELPLGEFLIGRGGDCQLSVDDPLVSRRHALLLVRERGTTLQDLGSRNGVLVNGARVVGSPRELADGDVLTFGKRNLLFLVVPERRALKDAFAVTQVTDEATPTLDFPRVAGSFRILAELADKALAVNRPEEAERILSSTLLELLARAREGKPIDKEAAEQAAHYAGRLAASTAKGSWVNYVFELYAKLGRPPPGSTVDELFGAVHKARGMNVALLRAYLAELRLSTALGPAERFLVQRLEGLERLVASK